MIYLISASYDLSVKIWNIDDAELVRVFYFTNPVISMEINEVGDVLVVGDSEGEIFVWDINKA